MKIQTYKIKLVKDGNIEACSMNSAKDVLKAVKSFVWSDREMFVALYLNARNEVIAHTVISIGTVNACLVHPREIFKVAILKNATAIIVAHNHPSGNPEPSEADIDVTKRLIHAGKMRWTQSLGQSASRVKL